MINLGDDEDAIYGTDDSSNVTTFMVDSGASVHCCCRAELFTKWTDHYPKKKVRVANKQFVTVHKIGEVEVYLVDRNGILQTITLKNVFYCPDMDSNLVSTKRLWKDSRIKTSLKDDCKLKDQSGGATNGCVYELPSTGKQYLMQSRKRYKPQKTTTVEALALEGVPIAPSKDAPDVSPDIVHARLGHTSASRIQRANRTSDGVPAVSSDDLSNLDCDGCDKGGSRKPHFHSRPVKYKFVKYGQRFHSDLAGPFPPDVYGNIYALCFVDASTDYSAWYIAPDHELDSKLSPRAWPAVHLGFDPARNGYMVYIPHKNTTGSLQVTT